MMQHNWVQTIYHHKLLVIYFDRTTVFYPLAGLGMKKGESGGVSIMLKI